MFSCFDENGESRWPQRFPTEVLMADKASYTRRNKLSVWMREMECQVVADELVYFLPEWLRYWDFLPDGSVGPERIAA